MSEFEEMNAELEKIKEDRKRIARESFIDNKKNRDKISTTIKQIVDYWRQRIESFDIAVDWDKADRSCWCCGKETKSIRRCHIIQKAAPFYGKDKPSNYVLLCGRCHLESPCVDDPNEMWRWIKRERADMGGLFWLQKGLVEYERIYGPHPYRHPLYNWMLTLPGVYKLIKQFRHVGARHVTNPLPTASVVWALRKIVPSKERVIDSLKLSKNDKEKMFIARQELRVDFLFL